MGTMCGRFVLFTTEQELLRHAQRVFGVSEIDAPQGCPPPRYNIAPTHSVPVFVATELLQDAATTAPLSLRAAWWGLLPHWKKDSTGPVLFNARAETVATKPSFRDAFARSRCVIPMDGYYEWKDKQPHFVHREDGELLWAAGVVATGLGQMSTTIITTASAEPLAWLHDRMPRLLTAQEAQAWLTQDQQAAEAIVSVAAPESLRASVITTPADTAVGRVGNDYPELIS